MKWTITQLKKEKDFHFAETLDLSDLKEQDPQIRAISPVEVSGYLVISGDTFTFPLRIKGTMILPCSRTLEDVKFPFDIECQETFLLGSSDTSEWEELDDDVHLIEGEVIDLVPYIKERILLEIPIQVYSEETEKEELRSGKDWQWLTEEEKQNRIDPRLAKLAKFFEKNEEEEKH